MENLINQFTQNQMNMLNVSNLIVALFFSFILSIFIAYVYNKTHKSVSYSRSFINSLIVICCTVSVIMIVIGGNIAIAFGVFGTLSMVRFRTALKDPNDMAFVFFVIAVGMANGIGRYDLALVSTLLISLVIFIMTKYDFGSNDTNDYILTFSLNITKGKTDIYKSLFKEYLSNEDLLNVHSQEEGKKCTLHLV